MTFTEADMQRYSRHILLPEIGGIGQKKLKEASVLIVGAGGLGSPLLYYLAAAGVGRLGLVDDDAVDLSNLQRQIVHSNADIGRLKVESAAEKAKALNPETKVDLYPTRLSQENAAEIFTGYDIIADGSDNFETRYCINDACVTVGKTLVSAAVLRFDGQLATFRPHLGGPCYRCVFPAQPPKDLIPSCSQAGVLGSLVGVLGSLQATEILKEILNIGESLENRLLLYDGLANHFRHINIKKAPDCPTCGT